MDELRQLIQDNLSTYPDFDDFFVQMDMINNEVLTPDVRLDSAKSLLEAIIKSTLGKIDPSLSKNQLNRMTTLNAADRLFGHIGNRTNDFDADFILPFIESIKQMSIIRNKRGDISHGHVAPKENSTSEFVNLAITYVISTGVYVLSYFYKLDLSYQYPLPYDHGDNVDFNNYLDENSNPIGKVPYSQALYELDHDAYIDQQDEFNN